METDNKPNIGIIIGSNPTKPHLPHDTDWVMKEMQHDDLVLNLIELAGSQFAIS